MRKPKPFTLLWVGWGLAFLVYEFYSLFKDEDRHEPLTNVVVRFVPGEITMTFIAWLAIHFGVRYWRKRQAT